MENNIEKNLYLYCLYDKETHVHDVLVTGFDDKDISKYYIDMFNDLYKSFENYYKGSKLDEERFKFLDKIHASCIYRLGYFDYLKGEVFNEKVMLVDLFDFEFDIKDNNESEGD